MARTAKTYSKKFVIYMFTFPNGKSYIGRTVDFGKRLRTHINKSSQCTYVKRCFNKYGIDGVDITILKADVQGLHLANQWEMFFIATFGTLAPHGLNMTPGGDGVCFTDEIRQKISKSLTGRKLSKEHRETLSIVGKLRFQKYGVSKYTRQKLREAMKGRVFTFDHCQKISKSRKALCIRLTDAQKQHLREINIGKKMAPEAVEKAVASRIANGNHRHKEETKKKIGDGNRGKERTEQHRLNMSIAHQNSTFDRSTTRKHMDEDVLRVFKECGEDRNKTAAALNVHYNTVFRCLKRNGMTNIR
ncbi:GIY-YIG catalytic domain-containing endonuclease [Acanthocystis turfacea Chlorella virus GM0701.1]|nr:GIY-YIG catalytic domain-containing endonuclease [Acanthocystis turfacea Chlorella virus GM0701.1]